MEKRSRKYQNWVSFFSPLLISKSKSLNSTLNITLEWITIWLLWLCYEYYEICTKKECLFLTFYSLFQPHSVVECSFLQQLFRWQFPLIYAINILHTGKRTCLIFYNFSFMSKSWLFTSLQVGNPGDLPKLLVEFPSLHFCVAVLFSVSVLPLHFYTSAVMFCDVENRWLWGRHILTFTWSTTKLGLSGKWCHLLFSLC